MVGLKPYCHFFSRCRRANTDHNTRKYAITGSAIFNSKCTKICMSAEDLGKGTGHKGKGEWNRKGGQREDGKGRTERKRTRFHTNTSLFRFHAGQIMLNALEKKTKTAWIFQRIWTQFSSSLSLISGPAFADQLCPNGILHLATKYINY